MRDGEVGISKFSAEVEPGMRPVEPMPALQFRIPHSALRIKWLILAEHTLGPPAESIPGTGCSCSLLPAPCSLYGSLLPASHSLYGSPFPLPAPSLVISVTCRAV